MWGPRQPPTIAVGLYSTRPRCSEELPPPAPLHHAARLAPSDRRSSPRCRIDPDTMEHKQRAESTVSREQKLN
nr:unnamed protein product [Digitaria exilis]